MTDSTGTTQRTYDAENRVLTKTVPSIGTISYQYDILGSDGEHSEISTDPKGNSTQKQYDKAGRLAKVTEESNSTGFAYYEDGSRKSVVYPDGSREDYTYYKDGLLKTLVNKQSSGSILDTYSYTYDGAHNQTSKTDSKGLTRYEYDSLNRLSQVTEPGGKVTSYTYDKAGNRTQETVLQDNTGTTTTYSYNEQNRLTDTASGNGSQSEKVRYEYDNNGNTLIIVKETTKPIDPEQLSSFVFRKAGTSTTREAVFMEYDVWNQMTGTTTGDKTLEYKYNGEGYRVEKAVNDQITRYMYEADKVILEVDGQGNETARNIYGTNLLMRTAGAEKYFYMYNGHGDVTALIGTDGVVAATYYYDAFGNPVVEGTNEGGINNPIRYAGYQWDGETEIYYLNARYYDPKIARFLTEDTYRGRISDPLSLNLYTYCHNEPVMYTDPTGHWEQGDSKRKAAEQAQILEATKEYISAKEKGDKAGMDKAHQKAEDARAGKVYKADNITSSSIEKALKEVNSSKYVYKSAKDDVKKSTMASVVRDVSDKNPYKAQVERGQAQTISAINSERKSSNILDPAKAPRGTIGLGGISPKTTIQETGGIGISGLVATTKVQVGPVTTYSGEVQMRTDPNSPYKLGEFSGSITKVNGVPMITGADYGWEVGFGKEKDSNNNTIAVNKLGTYIYGEGTLGATYTEDEEMRRVQYGAEVRLVGAKAEAEVELSRIIKLYGEVEYGYGLGASSEYAVSKSWMNPGFGKGLHARLGQGGGGYYEVSVDLAELAYQSGKMIANLNKK